MRLASTSTQRTYRYVRLSILGAVVAMTGSLVIVVIADGPITSLSALFYTPGRTVFTGVLCAVALALLALSGHSVEQVLLDAAALCAPLIAVIPTPVQPGDAPGVSCPGDAPCVPVEFVAGVHNGVLTFVMMAVLGVVSVLALARVRGTGAPATTAGGTRRGASGARPPAPPLPRGVKIVCVAAIALAAALLAWLLAAPDSLLLLGHFVATAAFFGLMSAVAVIAAITATRPWRPVYIVVAVGMAASLLFLCAVGVAKLAGADLAGQPWILIGESGLIAFFAVFWIAQTAQKWNEIDPSLVAG